MGVKKLVKNTAETVTTKATNTSDVVRGAIALRKQQKEVMRGVGARLREKAKAERLAEEAKEAAEIAAKKASEAGLTTA